MISRDSKHAIIFSVTFLLGVLLYWIGCSYFEARAFNSVTGKSVSTWDAMFIQLRVQEKAGDDGAGT